MILTLLHTAEAHRATFDTLAARAGEDVTLDHVVRPDLLDAARSGLTPAIEAEIAAVIGAAPGPVLCTCSTLGDVAEAHGALRIDAPLMDRAAGIAASGGGSLLLAYCLESTLAPSVALLERALAAVGHKTRVHTLSLSNFWPLFEAGQGEAFGAVIAAHLRDAVTEVPDLAAVVLAQASMAGASDLLSDLSVPVLSAPELALDTALSRNGRTRPE